METGDLTGTWNVPGGLQNPHDVAVSEDGNIIYVVELNPFKVWKLTNGGFRTKLETISSGNRPIPNNNILNLLKSRLGSLFGFSNLQM